MASAAAPSIAHTPTGQIPLAAPARPGWKDSFSSLRVYNYRLYVTGQIVGNTGTWMQRVAQDWLVLQLTHNVGAVGITVALQFAPMLFFGLVGGVVVDRYPKRTLLTITQTFAGLSAATLATLTLTGAVQAWQVFAIAFFLGMVTVIDNPSRQAFVNELVGRKNLRNAISLNSSIFQLGGLVGPAIAGVMIHAVGEGWAFAINAVGYIYVVIVLRKMRTGELEPAPRQPRAKGQLREGLKYIAGKPEIIWTVVLVAFVGLFSLNMTVLLAAFAARVYDTGSSGYGMFNSLVAIGSLTGALASTRRSSVRLRGLVLAVGAVAVFQLVAAVAPDRITFSILLIPIGAATLMFLTGANSLIQLTTAPGVRGRVMALYLLVLIGAQAIGGLVMGQVAEHLGPRGALAICGSVPLIAAVVIGIVLARVGRLRLTVDLHRHGLRSFVRIVGRDGQTHG
ncbi:MFS transporter [Spelaeicoccus albus]|uniref:MFS family permease n=1 Tax=Spelaeicoccus albus TaxID=1280376 RepID=A0A7Z0ABZ4_9MICO|nr:MFS transporter [Spelaeicoccus albus]NYI66351.1 MFS family permease [Spelaeicoccus albus]